MLTVAQINNLPLPSNRAGKKYLVDAYGLHIRIFPNGTRCWRYRYFYYGKEKELALGVYPLISLKQAKKAHLEARKLLAQGIDPCTEKQRLKQQKRQEVLDNSFAQLFNSWYEVNLDNWQNDKHKWQVKNNFEHYVLPHIGNLPITSISTPQISYLLRLISHMPETMTRTRQRIKAVFDYAISVGRCTYNPASYLEKVKKKKQKVIHQPALPIELLPEFFVKLEAYPSRSIQLAITLLILTWLRNTELRLGEWSEIKGNEWHIPEQRMKMKNPHIVPLSNWALEILEELKSLSKNKFIITGRTGKPLSDATLSLAMRRMGYKGIATPHGFRRMASTFCNESELFSPDAIERQLAHANPNEVAGTYDQSKHLKTRHQMMQWYSDYIKKQYLIAKGEL